MRTKLEELEIADAKGEEGAPSDALEEENWSKTIMDMSLREEIRLEALSLYTSRYEFSETWELVTRLVSLYRMSGISTLREFLCTICRKTEQNPLIKAMITKALIFHKKSAELGYDVLSEIFPTFDGVVPTPMRFESVTLLMRSERHTDLARDYMCTLCTDPAVECDYRYKAILRLEALRSEDVSDSRRRFFILEAQKAFVRTTQNPTRYRTLSAQYILRNEEIPQELRKEIEEILLGFSEDEELDMDTRADATDVLLQLGRGAAQDRAREIIMILGMQGRSHATVFENAQNVHTEAVEESVETTIGFLHEFDILKINSVPITYEYVVQKIEDIFKAERKLAESERKLAESKRKLAESEEDACEEVEEDASEEVEEDADAVDPTEQPTPREEKIRLALNRISMDRAVYSKFSCSLENLLLRVWTVLAGHEHEEEMKKRLLEELEEMAGTCSSGYASRLCNVLSGFTEHGIRISWRDQIIAGVSARLNSRLREMDDLRKQRRILDQMTVNTTRPGERKQFLRFFRDNILGIRDEMYQEYREHMEDAFFDLYFRAAISNYESGSWV